MKELNRTMPYYSSAKPESYQTILIFYQTAEYTNQANKNKAKGEKE